MDDTLSLSASWLERKGFMFLQRAREISRIGKRSMDRRRFLTLATGAIGVGALTPFLAACGGDDDGDDPDVEATGSAPDADTTDDEALQDAMEQAKEETDAEFDATNGDDDGTFPDDFPDNIPLPDDWEITSDLTRERDGSREISIRFESYGDRMGMIETYDAELLEDYRVSSQLVEEEEQEATWIIHDDDWEWGSVVLSDPREDADADFEVYIQLHEFMR